MDSPETPEELEARVEQAYAAYVEAMGGVDESHRPLGRYQELHDIHKGAWRAAVRAALAPETPAPAPGQAAGTPPAAPAEGTPQTHPADQPPPPKVDEGTLPPAHPPGQTPTSTVTEAARHEPEHHPATSARRPGTASPEPEEGSAPPGRRRP